MIWSTYFFLEKKYLILLPFLIILFYIKVQNLIILLVFFYFYFIYQNIHKFKFLICNLLLILVAFLLFGDFVVDEINMRRQGLYEEEFGGYRGITSANTYQKISFDLNLFFISLKSFFMFVTSPIFSTNSWLKIITIIEILVLYIFFIRYFFVEKKIETNNLIFLWSLVLVFSFVFYSLAVFNDGTIQRYRLELIFFSIFGYNIHKYKILENKRNAK